MADQVIMGLTRQVKVDGRDHWIKAEIQTTIGEAETIEEATERAWSTVCDQSNVQLETLVEGK